MDYNILLNCCFIFIILHCVVKGLYVRNEDFIKCMNKIVIFIISLELLKITIMLFF